MLGEFNTVMVRPLMNLPIFHRRSRRLAVVKGGAAPLVLAILHIQPGIPAQRLDHEVKLYASLLGVLCGVILLWNEAQRQCGSHPKGQESWQESQHRKFTP